MLLNYYEIVMKNRILGELTFLIGICFKSKDLMFCFT